MGQHRMHLRQVESHPLKSLSRNGDEHSSPISVMWLSIDEALFFNVAQPTERGCLGNAGLVAKIANGQSVASALRDVSGEQHVPSALANDRWIEVSRSHCPRRLHLLGELQKVHRYDGAHMTERLPGQRV